MPVGRSSRSRSVCAVRLTTKPGTPGRSQPIGTAARRSPTATTPHGWPRGALEAHLRISASPSGPVHVGNRAAAKGSVEEPATASPGNSPVKVGRYGMLEFPAHEGTPRHCESDATPDSSLTRGSSVQIPESTRHRTGIVAMHPRCKLSVCRRGPASTVRLRVPPAAGRRKGQMGLFVSHRAMTRVPHAPKPPRLMNSSNSRRAMRTCRPMRNEGSIFFRTSSAARW